MTQFLAVATVRYTRKSGASFHHRCTGTLLAFRQTARSRPDRPPCGTTGPEATPRLQGKAGLAGGLSPLTAQATRGFNTFGFNTFGFNTFGFNTFDRVFSASVRASGNDPLITRLQTFGRRP